MTEPRRMVRVFVHGHVQGVYFRSWTVEQATRRGLDGWVRNRADGSVEAVLSGPPDDVAAMLEAMRDGPRNARVAGLDVQEESSAPPGGFVQRPTV